MEQDEVGGRRIVRLEASFVVSRLKICRTLDPDVPEPFTETFCDSPSLRYHMIGSIDSLCWFGIGPMANADS